MKKFLLFWLILLLALSTIACSVNEEIETYGLVELIAIGISGVMVGGIIGFLISMKFNQSTKSKNNNDQHQEINPIESEEQ